MILRIWIFFMFLIFQSVANSQSDLETAANIIENLNRENKNLKNKINDFQITIDNDLSDLNKLKKENISKSFEIQNLKSKLKLNINALSNAGNELKLKEQEIKNFAFENAILIEKNKSLELNLLKITRDNKNEIDALNNYEKYTNDKLVQINEKPMDFKIISSKNKPFIEFIDISPSLFTNLDDNLSIRMRFSSISGTTFFNNNLFVGIGLGYDKYTTFSTFPIYLSLKGKIAEPKIKGFDDPTYDLFYYTADFGYSFYQKNSIRKLNGNGNFMVSLGLGSIVYFTENYGIQVSP